MEPTDRKAFSFLRSYYEAACAIEDKEERADFYHAILTYVFSGEEMPLAGTPQAMFTLAKPNIETSLRRSASGKIGGKNSSKNKANFKQNSSKQESNEKQTGSNPQPIKDKGYMIKDNNIPPYNPPTGEGEKKTDFDIFWDEYPRREGKGAARKSFEKAIKKTTLDVLLDAIKKQKQSDQWIKDNGEFIPHPATWLNQERWEDELNYGGGSNGATAGKNMDRKSLGFESDVERFKGAVREAQERQQANAMGTLPLGEDSPGEGVRTTIDKPWERHKV